MLLALVASSFALTVPLRATFTEAITPGEDAVSSVTLTATATLTDPATGAAFAVRGDPLTVLERAAEGSGGMVFEGGPAGSLRTWALYSLDAEGNLLGEPDVLDVLFGRDGVGAVVGTARGAGRATVQRVVQLDGAYVANVRTTGTDAAFVGIVELSAHDGSGLVSDPDLTILDAATYATFLELDLDAIVALDQYRTTLDGTVEVTGLSVDAKGVVAGGEDLRWDLAINEHGRYFGEDCSRVRVCSVQVASASYLASIGKVKPKSGVAARVALQPGDMVFDTYDAAITMTLDADLRGFELAAALDVYDDGRIVDGADVHVLDPSGLGVQAMEDEDDDTGVIVDIFIDGDCEDCGDYDYTGAPPPTWAWVADELVEVAVYDGAGSYVASHTCSLSLAAPAEDTDEDVLVGECTRSDAGTEVRRLRAAIREDDTSTWTVDLGGAAFLRETTAPCMSRTCPEGTTTGRGDGSVALLLDGVPFVRAPLSVEETAFDLPFSFTEDVGRRDAALFVELYAPDAVSWWEVEGVVYARDADGVVASFDLDGVTVAGTGSYALKGTGDGWHAIDATPQEQSSGPNESPFALHFTPGQFTRMNSQLATYR